MEWKREVTVNCRIWGEGIYEGKTQQGLRKPLLLKPHKNFLKAD